MHTNWSLDRCESLYHSNSDKLCKYFHSLSHCTWIMPVAKGLNDWSLSHPSSNFLLYFFWPLGVAVAFHRRVKMEKGPYLSSHQYRVPINGYLMHLSCSSHMTMTGRRRSNSNPPGIIAWWIGSDTTWDMSYHINVTWKEMR